MHASELYLSLHKKNNWHLKNCVRILNFDYIWINRRQKHRASCNKWTNEGTAGSSKVWSSRLLLRLGKLQRQQWRQPRSKATRNVFNNSTRVNRNAWLQNTSIFKVILKYIISVYHKKSKSLNISIFLVYY